MRVGLDAVARRTVLAAALAVATPPSLTARADSALWPRDGLFRDCPAADVCVSSQDDRPQSWDNPWIFEGSLADSYASLRRVIGKLGGRIVAADGERYLRAEFEDRSPLGTSVDDAEFFFTQGDDLVQFRSERRGGTGTDFGANRKRLERARIALGWEKVPVLRNRRRAYVARLDLSGFASAIKTIRCVLSQTHRRRIALRLLRTRAIQ